LMGFTRDQMKARFSEIEAFAGIGEFMDQPVKTYSSGMFMRAAFSAAIHVDPDILIVDEALAVGDVQFQSKCYRKFLEFQKQGKTILFVTHDMQTVAKHCDEVILLEGGRVMGQGNARDMIYRYWDLMMGAVEPLEDRISLSESSEKKETQSSEKKEKQPQFEPNNEELKAFLNQVTKQDQCPDRPNYNPSEYRYGSGDVQIVDYLIMVNDHVFPSVVRVGERVEVYLKAVGRKKIQNPTYGFGLRTVDSVLLYGTNTSLYRIFCPAIQPNEQVIYKFTFSVNISPGTYFLGLGVGDKVTGKQDDAIDRRYDLIQFNVESSDVQKQFDGVVHADCQIESLVSVV